MRDTFIATLSDMAEHDDRVVLITGDLGFKVFDEYRERFPRQFLNAGVSEQNMTMLATGMAMEGWTTFTYSIANFATLRCLEMIRNDAAYHGANVNVVCIGGGFSYGALGPSHHATEDLSIMRSLPDVTVVAPCGLWETAQATRAIARLPGTCYLRLDKSSGDDRPEAGGGFEIGRGRVLQEGDDVTFLVAGGILGEVWAAVQELTGRGISARVVSLHTIKPLDVPLIVESAGSGRALVTVEENTIHGGLGSAVAAALLDSGVVPKRFHRIALEAGFSSIVGSQDYLRRRYGMDRRAIVDRVLAVLDGTTLER